MYINLMKNIVINMENCRIVGVFIVVLFLFWFQSKVNLDNVFDKCIGILKIKVFNKLVGEFLVIRDQEVSVFIIFIGVDICYYKII